MTGELWQRLKPVYTAALELPEQARSTFLDHLSQSDPELARELKALLKANESAANTLDPPFVDLSLLNFAQPSVLAPGTLLVNRFRIVRHLGSGGMGDVYEAHDTRLEQGRIALKTLRPEIARDPVALAHFKDEVVLARKITGPNICRIHELYLSEPDCPNPDDRCFAFLTMELLEGITLHDRISQNSPLPVPEIRSIAEQLCAALSCIHEAGITHRDLKPRNVMLVPHTGAERAVVMDFGLASAAPPSRNAGLHASASAMVAGTPGYMAPEQFEGHIAGPATDIYALGLILYEMATGIQPFAAHTPLIAAIRRSQRPRPASSLRTELPPIWDDIIARCLEYDPDARFQSSTELLHALKHPGKVVLRLGKTRRLAIPRVTLLSAAIALVITLSVASWIFFQNAERRTLTPEVARWYDSGMAALREGSYLKAIHLLDEVTKRDPTYPLAHAALADAWTELDFTESAQREMLLASAPDDQHGLSSLERRYIDAVRTTLTRDYSAAAQDYEAILNKDPQNRKADAYVDLGRIYEKAGKVPETVAAYEKAAQLNPDDPAPFLHLGMLKSRLREPQAAAQSFSRAESLYTAESDPEGLAEVIYQRGYAANEAGDFKRARTYLEKSLDIARQIPSAQLQARSLSQLSSVEDNLDDEEQALKFANQASVIATDNGLSYWQTDSLVRLGSAYMGKEMFPAAEQSLQAALQQAQRDSHPRLEAFAALSLASLCDQQQRPDDQIKYANIALTFYQDYGFLAASDKALLLIARGEHAKGQYEQALKTDEKMLETANRAGSSQFIALAEEDTGNLLLDTESYPEALAHYQHALQVTISRDRNPAYQQVHCAEALWHLGRYREADESIAAITPDMRQRDDIGISILSLQALQQQSQGKAQSALSTADQALQKYPKMTPAESFDLSRARVMALLQLDRRDEAKLGIGQLASAAGTAANTRQANQVKLLQANIALDDRDLGSAERQADAAASFFRLRAMPESLAETLLLQAKISAAGGNTSKAVDESRQALDIWRKMEQSWGVSTFQMYANRPDIWQALQDTASLQGIKGASFDELFKAT